MTQHCTVCTVTQHSSVCTVTQHSTVCTVTQHSTVDWTFNYQYCQHWWALDKNKISAHKKISLCTGPILLKVITLQKQFFSYRSLVNLISLSPRRIIHFFPLQHSNAKKLQWQIIQILKKERIIFDNFLYSIFCVLFGLCLVYFLFLFIYLLILKMESHLMQIQTQKELERQIKSSDVDLDLWSTGLLIADQSDHAVQLTTIGG